MVRKMLINSALAVMAMMSMSSAELQQVGVGRREPVPTPSRQGKMSVGISEPAESSYRYYQPVCVMECKYLDLDKILC